MNTMSRQFQVERVYTIISLSARSLSASARLAGYKINSIDCFAGKDTKNSCVSSHKVTHHAGVFNEKQLNTIIKKQIAQNPNTILVSGSGFESCPQQLSRLKKWTQLIANEEETILQLKKPKRFFQILEKNGISYPEIPNKLSDNNKTYLIKEIGGHGGTHVNYISSKTVLRAEKHYLQKYIAGKTLSAVFLANGIAVRLIGFNQQIQTDKFPEMPFLYQGAIKLKLEESKTEDKKLIREITRIITLITLEVNLKGLCGIDFILDQRGDIHVLEINPRPPATFELHDHLRSPLFTAHIDCFQTGEMNYEPDPSASFPGYAVLYAKREINKLEKTDWPEWVKDRPDAGDKIHLKSPLCTVFADTDSIEKTRAILFERMSQIESDIMNMHDNI